MRFIKNYRLLIVVLLLILTASLVFSGCSSREQSSENSVAAPEALDTYYGLTENSDQAISEELKLTSIVTTNSEQYGQMIIYNGSFYIEANDIDDAARQINTSIVNSKGYLTNSYKNESSNQLYAHYEFKIPAGQFHNIFSQIENMSIGKITSQNTGSIDVTEEYYDLDARLKAKRAYEARLLEFLTKAEKTEDLLKISNDLNRVQEEIESLMGRQKYLEHNINYSTLVIELVQYKDKVAPTATTIEKAIGGFKDSIRFVVDLFEGIFIWSITFIPILVVLTILIVIVWVIRRRYKHRKKVDIDEKDNSDGNKL